MKSAHSFIPFWIVNTVFLLILPFIFSTLVVTGNDRLSPIIASLISGFLLTLTNALIFPALDSVHVKLKDDWQLLTAILMSNIVGIWLIGRYADLTGVGISDVSVALFVGILATLVQFVFGNFLYSSGRK